MGRQIFPCPFCGNETHDSVYDDSLLEEWCARLAAAERMRGLLREIVKLRHGQGGEAPHGWAMRVMSPDLGKRIDAALQLEEMIPPSPDAAARAAERAWRVSKTGQDAWVRLVAKYFREEIARDPAREGAQ